jgi:hypothetical protein
MVDPHAFVFSIIAARECRATFLRSTPVGASALFVSIIRPKRFL